MANTGIDSGSGEATEQARRILADYHGFLLAQLQHEKARANADAETLAELEEHQAEVLREQQSLTPAAINKALTVYGPFLKTML